MCCAVFGKLYYPSLDVHDLNFHGDEKISVMISLVNCVISALLYVPKFADLLSTWSCALFLIFKHIFIVIFLPLYNRMLCLSYIQKPHFVAMVEGDKLFKPKIRPRPPKGHH